MLSSGKVNVARNPNAVMGLYVDIIHSGKLCPQARRRGRGSKMANFDTTLFKNGHLAIVRMDLALSIVGTKTTMRPKYFSKLFLHAFLNPNIFFQFEF